MLNASAVATPLRTPTTPAHRRLRTQFGAQPESSRRSTPRSSRKRTSAAPLTPPLPIGIVNVTWRLYRVTPLHALDYSERSLKRMGRALSAFLQSHTLRGSGVATHLPDSDAAHAHAIDSNLSASISTVLELAISDQDSPSLKIVVEQQDKGNWKPAVTLLLCSVGIDLDQRPSKIVHGQRHRHGCFKTTASPKNLHITLFEMNQSLQKAIK
eukprot:m.119005 g.119005  ORF g.119005 m.119005 type:complete len:212 (-) comp13670_c1_seq5:1730-2365(-)